MVVVFGAFGGIVLVPDLQVSPGSQGRAHVEGGVGMEGGGRETLGVEAPPRPSPDLSRGRRDGKSSSTANGAGRAL